MIRRGFTLIEVASALAIGGILLLGSRAAFEQLIDHTEHLTVASRNADASANGERLMRALASRVETGQPNDVPFEGSASLATFTSWCDTPKGWQERCVVTLTVDSTRSRLVVAADGEEQVVRVLDGVELQYLADARLSGTWYRVWGESILAPVAIGIMSASDTTILPLGISE